jgi:hypothetical protein
MIKFINVAATIGALALATHAHAGITAITIGMSGSVPGHNWAKGDHWNVRAILLDSSLHPIGSLTPPAIFNTTTNPLTPEQVTVTFDASAPIGTIVRVYRSTAPFAAGDNVAYADYNICPCVSGDAFVSVSGRMDNDDFTASQSALPVQLQDFSVD